MTAVGQIEKQTQARVVALFRERLCYDYLGDKTDLDNRNIEETLLRSWLAKQGVGDTLINRALHELNKVATDTSKMPGVNYLDRSATIILTGGSEA